MKKILLSILFLLCVTPQAFSMQIKTGTYTGNVTDDRNITGTGFQPEAIIIVNSSYNSCLYLSSMSAGTSTGFNGSNNTNMIQSVSSDGFQVGTDDRVNHSGTRYDWVAFDDDGTADIYVGSYTGNGTDNRDYTDANMGFTPEWVIISNLSDNYAQRTSQQTGDNAYLGHAVYANLIQNLQTNGFQLGGGGGVSNYVNYSGATYYYLALKGVTSLLVFGSYTGDGNDNRNITGVGFQPDYVILKRQDDRYFFGKGNSTDGTDVADFFSGSTESNVIQDIISDGFQVGNSDRSNSNTNGFFYIALQDGTSPSGVTTRRVHLVGN